MAATVRTWDLFVRIFHWSLVASFVLAWASGDDGRSLHLWAGYAAAALITLRIGWGLVGPRNARFAHFVKSPRTVAAYLAGVGSGRAPRHLGHNPAGGAMIVALLVGLVGVSLSGWLYTTDTFWGAGWLEEIHEFAANALLVLVALHVVGVLIASRAHGENLVRAMWTGRKRPAANGDVS